MESIIVALITGAVTLTGSILTFIISSKQTKAQQKKDYEQQLRTLHDGITQTLENHRTEYINGIDEVRDSIAEMKATYQQTVAVIELKIDALEKKQDKHNNLMERTYKIESDIEVLKNRESVSEHRIEDLERK